MGVQQQRRRFQGEFEGDYFSNRLILIMCGIAGICHINGRDGVSLNNIKRMIGALCHRGPDETGIYIDDQVALGHARLSIIDLSSGVQPIHNEDKSLWIIYNGEVFNYPELKKDLLQQGHHFYTTSDTEVVLTGEGADEVFGGYNIFREAKVRRFMAKYPDSKSRAELIGRFYPYIFHNPRLKRTLQSFFAKGLDQIDDPIFSHFIRWENTGRIKTFFSQELNDAIGQYDGYEQVRRSLPEGFEQADDFSRAQYLEMAIFLSNYLLSSQGDRVAMAHSVEIRLPFLDPRVIDFAARLPAKWKILGLNEKHILKKSFEGILPKEITSRPKNPYRAPIKQSLLNEKTAEYTKEALSEKSISNAGLFDAGKVTKLLRKAHVVNNLSEIDSMALVGILSSQIIHRKFVQDFSRVSADSVTPALVVDRRSEALRTVS